MAGGDFVKIDYRLKGIRLKFTASKLQLLSLTLVLSLGLLSCQLNPSTGTPPPVSPAPLTATFTLSPPTLTPTVTLVPIPSPPAGGWNLGRAFARLANENRITLGFLGGSITSGAGASNPEITSYRALVTQWFKEQYPDANIEMINGGVGGTGSTFGAFRAYHDVGAADLVFIEFAVNDGGANASNQADFLKYTEGIVRHLYSANPDVEIVFVDLARDFSATQYANGGLPVIVQIHRNIANHYTIPGQNAILYTNPGKDMVEYINSGQASWTGGSNPLTVDNVHPNDVGYQFIADKIMAALQFSKESSTTLPAFVNMPESLHFAPVDNGQLVDTINSVWATGDWTYRTPSNFPVSFVSQMDATVVGATLDYTFDGKYVGVSIIQSVSGGSFDAWVDDGGVKNYTLTGPSARNDLILISDHETNGTHTLHIKVTSLPVTILAFAISP